MYRIFVALGTWGERAGVADRRMLAAHRRAPLKQDLRKHYAHASGEVRQTVTAGRSGAG